MGQRLGALGICEGFWEVLGGPWSGFGGSLGVLGGSLGVLGVPGKSLGLLEGSLGLLLGRPWEVLGGSWGIPGGPLGAPGGVSGDPWECLSGLIKTLKNHCFSYVLSIWRFLGEPWRSFWSLGSCFGEPWGALKRPWELPEGSLGVLGGSLGVP